MTCRMDSSGRVSTGTAPSWLALSYMSATAVEKTRGFAAPSNPEGGQQQDCGAVGEWAGKDSGA